VEYKFEYNINVASFTISIYIVIENSTKVRLEAKIQSSHSLTIFLRNTQKIVRHQMSISMNEVHAVEPTECRGQTDDILDIPWPLSGCCGCLGRNTETPLPALGFCR